MKINQLYILRFIAALLVVFYHYFTDHFKNVPVVHTIMQHGNEAVNFFFILSGLVMVVAYDNKLNSTKEYKDYWVNRWARIFPVYLFALLLFIGYYYFIDSSTATSVAVRLPLEVTFLQAWFGKSSLNYPGWSLSVEMFFYLLFPFLFNWVRNRNTKVLVGIFVLLYTVTQVLYYILHAKTDYLTDPNISGFVYYAPYFHILTFYLGMITGIIFLRNKETIYRHSTVVKAGGYIGALLLTGILFLLPERFVNIKLGLLTPIYALFLFSFSIESAVTRFHGNRFFVFLGDISYSIYILQFPALLYTMLLPLQRADVLFMYVYLAVLFIASTLTFYGIEKPCSQMIRRGYKKLHNKSFAAKTSVT